MLPLRFPNSRIRAKVARKGGGWPLSGPFDGRKLLRLLIRVAACSQAARVVPAHEVPPEGSDTCRRGSRKWARQSPAARSIVACAVATG
ncbi:hypothetical protein B296_00040063 [Ensete ventricosum]|uniref:Uncharacterized protein n=1 Tax=Ensete ventricosum TaxID=4639 RepID=A0A426Y7S8_ENSVE|nr:hypothetical protein B296_00040063 [Ensete ventricosum]